MPNSINVPLTPAQIVQIVRAIDKAGPEHAAGPSAAEHAAATHRARALVHARAMFVETYMRRPMPSRTQDSLPMTLPFAPPWRLERFFNMRVGLFEPQNEAVDIPHEGSIT